MNNPLQKHRDLLDKILDQLIPANAEKGIPAAGEAGIGDFIESRASNEDTVFDALNVLLAQAEEMTSDVDAEMVAALEAGYPTQFLLLLNLTYMGYYGRPENRGHTGVGDWPVHPKGYEVPLESPDMMNKLTAPVRSRGPMYRKPVRNSAVSS